MTASGECDILLAIVKNKDYIKLKFWGKQQSFFPSIGVIDGD